MTVLIADFENRSGNPVFTGALEQALSVAMEGASFISAYPRTDAARLTTSATTAPGRLTDENARLVALREGIHVVLAGSIEQSADGFQLSLRQLTPAGELLASVTERATTPTEVLTAIGEGLSNAEIAKRQFVAESTVKTHVGRLLTKLDARDRVHLVIYAYEHGLLRPQGRP